MAPRKKSTAPLALVPDEVPAESPPASAYYRVKPDGAVGRFTGTQAGLMKLEFPDGGTMTYEAADLEPAEAPAAPPALTDDQELQVRALWHDARVAPAVALVQQLLGVDMDTAKAKAIELSQLGPPPAGYALPTEEAPPRSLEDQVVHPGEALPRPHVQRDDDLLPEPVAPEPPTGVRSLGVKTIEMQVELTPEEWATRAGELAQTEETIALEELRQKGVRSALKATMDEMKGERHRLACAVRERKESRTVEVQEYVDHDLGEVRTVEVATGRVLARSAIRGEHAQLTLADAIRSPSRAADSEGDDEGNEGEDEGDADTDEPEDSENTDD
jgi:hypothetical protein